jgi:hypothetical protein
MCLLAAMMAAPMAARAAVSESNFAVATGADLAALCSTTQDDKLYTAAQNFCEAFALGAYRVLKKDEDGGGLHTFCVPEPTPSRDQIKDAYVAFIARSATAAAEPAEDSVLRFLQQQYPCGGAK